MNMINKIENFSKKNILVIGDVMLDRYLFGQSNRLSPEAPVPILKKDSETIILGGAGNVALNLAKANQNVSLLTVIGNDNYGAILLDTLSKNKINKKLVLKESKRTTTVKNRFIGPSNTQMFRFDEETTSSITENTNNKLFEKLRNEIKNYDVAIISDYNKGLLNEKNTQQIIKVCNNNHVKVLVDIKEPNYKKYKNAFLLKPNLKELSEITKSPVDTDKDVEKASKLLKKNTNCAYVLATQGKNGMSLTSATETIKFSCKSREVFDVTGAGDTVISYLAISLANDIEIKDSVLIANYAAGVKVKHFGTYGVTPKDIINYINYENNQSEKEKIVGQQEIAEILKNQRNKKIVFTNGCFDIFHVGHARYLKESSSYGDILIVGVNSDKSVRKIKGKDRPINSEKDRMELLAQLKCVSYVVKFDENTPYNLIKIIRPDVITKAGDYKKKNVIGKDIVEKNGGKVVICKYIDNKSTTSIINKIIETDNNE